MDSIKAYVRYYIKDYLQSIKRFLLNEEPVDNNCYLAFNVSLEEIVKCLPTELQNKVVMIDYPHDNVFIDKRKAPV